MVWRAERKKEKDMQEMFGFYVVFLQAWRLWDVPVALLAIVPAVLLVGALFVWNFRAGRGALKKSAWLRRFYEDDARPRPLAYLRRFIVSALIVSLAFIVWAEPNIKTLKRETVWGGVRIAFMPDVSLSMKHAHDVPPYLNRLEAMKAMLAAFSNILAKDIELRGKYKLALIPFAGSAVVIKSFSTDLDEFTDVVGLLDEQTVNNRGTNLRFLFQEYEMLVQEDPPRSEADIDIVVLMSDGGKGEEVHKDIPHVRAILSRLPNTIVFTVGIGSVEVLPDGTRVTKPVPLEIRGPDGEFLGYALHIYTDPAAKIYYSELDENILIEVAGSPERYVFYENQKQLLAALKRLVIENRKVESVISRAHLTPIGDWVAFAALAFSFFAFGFALRAARFILAPFVELWRMASRGA